MPESTCDRIVGFLQRGVVEDYPLETIFEHTDMPVEFTPDELARIKSAARQNRPHLYKKFFSTPEEAEKEINQLIEFIKLPDTLDEKIITQYDTLTQCHKLNSKQLTPIHENLRQYRPLLNEHPQIVATITRHCLREVLEK